MTLAKLRLFSGLVILLFLICHLVNLGLGVFGLEALEAGRVILMGPFSNPVGVGVLLLAVGLHATLGLLYIARRSYSALSAREWMQFLPALLVPPLLFSHASTMSQLALTDLDLGYKGVLLVQWVLAPELGFQQVIVLVLAWFHGAQGLLNWLQYKHIWDRISTMTILLLAGIPSMALLGYMHAGRLLSAQYTQADIEAVLATVERLDRNMLMDEIFVLVYGIAVGVVFVVRFVTYRYRCYRYGIDVFYDNARRAKGFVGQSILDISRQNHIEHRHMCNGHGRCFTCRVDLHEGADAFEAPNALEQEAMEALGPGIRLACQCVIARPPKDKTIKIERKVVRAESRGINMMILWQRLNRRERKPREKVIQVEADGG